MTNNLVTIEDQLLVTATGGFQSYIDPDLRQAGFKGKQLKEIEKLPFYEQVKILNARIRRNAAQ